MIIARRLSRIRLCSLTAALAVTIAGIALTYQPVRGAEFKPDQVIPDFSLPTPDGSLLSLKTESGQISITLNNTLVQPTVVIVHLFQPDCLQCQTQMQALEALHRERKGKSVAVVGIAHRGDSQSVRALAQRLKITFPLAVGTGSPLALQFAAGDTIAIADRRATVRFAQVGYGKGDEAVWRSSIQLLLEGKPLAQKSIPRERLKVGDQLPAIELQSLVTDQPIALTGRDGRLTFRDQDGKEVRPKAVVGMFSRL